jgi:hypothetical protein
MKKITTLITTFVVLSFFAAMSARATLLWYEGFNYPAPVNGSFNLTNVSANVWTNFSGSGYHDMLVNTNVYTKLEVSTTGNAVTSRADDDARFFPSPYNPATNSTVTVFYASFTVICTNLPNGAGGYFASFYNNAFGYSGRVQAFTNGTVLPNTWRLGVSGNKSSTNAADGGYPVDLALNTAYQVVEQIDPSQYQVATIWVNPIDVSDSFSTDLYYSCQDGLGFALTNSMNAYAFRQASTFGNGFWIITNLAVATTFAEAATNVWATNAVAPSVVYQPIGVTNYVGASISLSAVANGQGLGSLTYKWQQNGTNYPGANANILNIPSAKIADSGDYTLVVTTHYGLSATSSVAKVSISAAPVPPSFVTQPVSQSVYKGQTVIFSTTVISPGTVTYQWKSNNVDIAGANASALELDNVATNFSASYRVGVTNNVVTNGILSSNAVLTVLNPAVVSIAYLRTLVDPLNGYQPTNNLTIPYQVTGIVTTFTNLTTGNTFSYFLQDGTAGIDIFATLGSTFRPAQGDVVTYIGVLSGYTTGLELYADTVDLPFTSYTDLSNNIAAMPTPITIPFDVTTNLDNMNYNIAGSLVRLTDVYFGTNAGTIIPTNANKYITVTNSSGKAFTLFFAFMDQDTGGNTLPSYAYSVTGVMYGINTNFSVAVTRFADIVTTPPPSLNAGFSGGSITFTWSGPSFSLQSSTNVTGPYTTIPGASSGFITNTASGQTRFYRLYHPYP